MTMVEDDDDDDDFEDLFSFGATTPGSPTETANEPSDFDILSDVSLSTPTTPGVTSSPGPGSAAGAPTVPTSTPRSAGGGDEFDALFGTPPAASATPRTPGGLTSEEKDSLLAIDESPNAGGGLNKPRHHDLAIDDFHVHDEDTRDMLDWLDDDTTGKKGKDDSSKDIASSFSGDAADLPSQKKDLIEDDDFDFDQMLDDATPSTKSTVNETNKISNHQSSQPKAQVPAEAETPLVVDNGNVKPDVSGTEAEDSTPMPVSKPAPVSACIEEELAFDQWEDENEDMQLTDAASSDAHDKSTDQAEGFSTSDGSGQKDGGGVEVKPPPPKKITFTSLSDAIRSNASTIDDVRTLFSRVRGFHNVSGDIAVSTEDRAHLWTKVICGKILRDIEDGSLADSYREWEKKGEVAGKFEGEEYDALIEPLLKQGCGIGKDDDTYEAEKQQLLSLSYFQSRNKSSTSSSLVIDPLIPPVALAVLQAGIPPAAASVVLSQIEPYAMPLLRLSHDERFLAAKALHADFYLLACYHLPLLVMHLDRHCPGWYWPRKGNTDHHQDEKQVDDNDAATSDDKEEKVEKDDTGESKDEAKEGEANEGEAKEDDKSGGKSGAETNPEKKKKSDLEQNGLVPLPWFVTNFAGECGGSCLDHKNLLQLWDHILTKGNHSLLYFLAIAVLEKKSDVLLMSRGDELKKELERILNFQETSFAIESFVGASEGATNTTTGDDDMASDWLSSAKSLMESTPSSVIDLLRLADDRAVASALKVRQAKVDEELQAHLDADDAARTKERQERDKEAERALNKARLTSYYREYAPEKIDTIDKILKLFDGRISLLNEKLKKKYGKGFLPDEALKDQTRSFLLSVNQSITETRKHVSVRVSERRKKHAEAMPEIQSHTPVVLEVSTKEVIPVICTTKGHNLITGRKMSPLKRTSDTDAPLQFYLVDCRPESIAAEQGRFPTSVSMSPEKLQDPEQIQKLTDMFESLRGAVHICVMGEGFASFKVLYNHTLSNAEEKLLEDDIARTSNCALFFLKKGFPFVSVLRGGFAAAHAFLSREGDTMGMTPPEVLVEYDPAVSLFAQLEIARQEEDQYKTLPAKEKTSRTLQRIIDNSMVRLTLEEQRINNLANDLAKPETMIKVKQSVSNFIAKPKTVPSIGFGRTPPLFFSKKFTSNRKEEEPEKKNEAGQAKKGKSSATILAEKMSNFKLPSFHSESSSTALSDVDIGDDEAENKTTPGSEETAPVSDPKDSSSNEGKVEDNSSGSASKISSASTSLTQRVQLSTTAPFASTADSGEPALEGDSPAPATAGSKISFSSFTNRIKSVKLSQQPADQPTNPSDQVTDTEISDDKKDSTTEQSPATASSSDKKETDGGIASDNTSKVSSAFASFTHRIQQSTATTASGSGHPITEGEPTEKESTGGKMSFSSFTSRIKLSQQPTDQTLKPSNEAKATEDKKDSAAEQSSDQAPTPSDEATEEKKDSITEKSEVEEPKTSSTDRFSKFTKSVGGGLSGLRERAVEAKTSYYENKDAVPETSKEEEAKATTSIATPTADNPADGGKLSKFTKSIGGSLSGIRNQPARQNPFASFYHSKPGPIEPKKSSEGEESEVTKTLTALGKIMLEDEPRPKTRFQRMAAEESISFGDDTDEAKTSSTTGSQEGGELNNLFSGLDTQPHGDPIEDLFADVPLTDDTDEVKPANIPESKVEEKPATAPEAKVDEEKTAITPESKVEEKPATAPEANVDEEKTAITPESKVEE